MLFFLQNLQGVSSLVYLIVTIIASNVIIYASMNAARQSLSLLLFPACSSTGLTTFTSFLQIAKTENLKAAI